MSSAFKTKYEVIKIIRDNVLLGLSEFGQTGWGCMEFGQASFQSADKIVTMNCNRVSRVGWQSDKYNAMSTRGTTEWVEEQHWQFQVILKRDNVPVTGSTITTQDIASMLITWFNGRGCMEFRKHGMANLRIDPSEIFVYNDDSDIYQKRAVFTMKLQVPKEFEYGMIAADVLKPEIAPI